MHCKKILNFVFQTNVFHDFSQTNNFIGLHNKSR
jgi:hypothetical protein